MEIFINRDRYSNKKENRKQMWMNNEMVIGLRNIRFEIETKKISLWERFLLKLLVDKTNFGLKLDMKEKNFALEMALKSSSRLN